MRIWRAIQEHRQNSCELVPAPPIRLSRLNSQSNQIINNQSAKIKHVASTTNCHCETCLTQNGVNGVEKEDEL